MVRKITNAMVGAVLGIMAMVLIHIFIASQDTTSWGGMEVAVLSIVGSIIGIIVIIMLFQSLRSGGGD